jgi:hypothetical protein
MSFVDEIYSLYRDQLNDGEEDAVAIALSVLKEQSREHVMQLIYKMSDDEIIQMMGIYLVEMLKMKMMRDGKLSSFKSVTMPPRLH